MSSTAARGIYLRELGRIFTGTATTVALPLGLAWVAWHRFYGFDTGASDPLDATFQSVALVLAPLAVWLTAPTLAAERREGTAMLWSISPVRPSDIILGKFGAAITFLLLAIAFLLIPAAWQPMVTEVSTMGRVLSGLLGLVLLCLLSGSVTLIVSAVATHFSTAFAVGLGIVAVWMWAGDVAVRLATAVAGLLPAAWVASFRSAADTVHAVGGKGLLEPLFVGWIDAMAVFGMLAVTALALVITHQIVASERWRN